MRRVGRSVSPSVLATAVILGGCQVIGGFAGNEVVDPEPSGGGGAAGAGGDQGAGGQGGDPDCTLLQAPALPTEAEPGDEVTFTLAARSLEVGEDLDEPLGLDIDDACTCGDGELCECASVPTCARPAVVTSDDAWKRCDAPSGVDRNSTQLFNILNTFDPLVNSALVSTAISSGGGTALIEVREYNGLSDDDKVFVAVYTAGPFQSAECNSTPPEWDGEDAWPIDRQSVFSDIPFCGGVPFPAVFDPNAYVANDQLVAQLEQASIAIQLGPQVVKLTMHDVTLLLPLQQDEGGRWFTEGATLAGRWLLEDVFRGLSEINQITPVDLCDPQMLVSTQSSVCAFVDTASHKRPGDPCDAVSFAAEFNAEEAKVGNTIDLPPSNPCPELAALDCETPVQ